MSEIFPPHGYKTWHVADRRIAEFMEPNKGKQILVAPEYHSDDSPRRLLNEVENKLLDRGLQARYHRYLVSLVMDTVFDSKWSEVQGAVVAPAINATAKQRCITIIETLDNSGE